MGQIIAEPLRPGRGRPPPPPPPPRLRQRPTASGQRQSVGGALDVSIRAQVLDLLIELQERLNLCYLFVTHDIGVVRDVCDRVAVMRKGCIVEICPTSQVCGAPAHACTKALISAVPIPVSTDRRIHLRPSDAGGA